MTKKVGMTLLGVAATNRPHVRLRDFPITLTSTDNGLPKARVPILVSGEYRHPRLPNKRLVIDEKAIDNMISNWESEAIDGLVGLDARHKPDLGYMVFFEKSKGGKIYKETVNGSTLLVGEGDVVSDAALTELKGFGAASAEIHLNYASNLIKRLENEEDDGEQFETGEITLILESEDESAQEVVVVLDENIEEEEEDMSDELQKRIEDLEAQLAQEREEKEAAVQLAAESRKSAREKLIESKLAQLSLPDDEGRVLPAYILNAAKEILAGKEFSGVVALDERDESEELNYYEEAILALCTNMPRMSQPQTRPDEEETVVDDGEEQQLEDGYDPEAETGLWGAYASTGEDE